MTTSSSPRTPTRRSSCSCDPSAQERRLLGAIPYQRNEAVLHTDSALLPRRHAARAAWNFHLLREPKPLSTVTYYMNHLQRLRADRDFCVTLNRTEAIDPAEDHPHDLLLPPRVHARGRRRAVRAREHQRPRRAHALLRRVLGLGLSRGRRAQRAARVRAVRGDAVSSDAPADAAGEHRASRACTRAPCATAATAAPADELRYRMFMVYLDLDELPECFDGRLLWSARRPALAWFRRADHLGDPRTPLADAVRELVAERTGTRPEGPIRLLTHLRYFGHCFNPVSFYYCYDGHDGNGGGGAGGERLSAVVAHVTNTPWGESHSYVLGADGAAEHGSTRAARRTARTSVCTSRR